MTRERTEDRERRHYRGRFPRVGIPGQQPRDSVGGPRLRPAGDGRDLVVLAGYGRSTASLAAALADAGLQALAFEAYDAAFREAKRLEPELILVEDTEEGGDVLHFLSRVGWVEWETLVLFLASQTDPEIVSRALEHGAHDVLSPPHSVAAILLRLHVSRMNGGRSRRDRTRGRRVSLGRLTLDLPTRQVLDGGRPFSLSGREFELLVRLIEARGDVVSRAALLEDIWGEDQASEAVLDATVHRLRKKLDRKIQEPDLVTTVRGIGYRLDSSSLEVE